MPQPRVHTWTFDASTPEGIVVKLRAYLADMPLVEDIFEYEPDAHPVILTDDGELVQRIEQGVYALVPSGVTVSSSDPKAP